MSPGLAEAGGAGKRAINASDAIIVTIFANSFEFHVALVQVLTVARSG